MLTCAFADVRSQNTGLEHPGICIVTNILRLNCLWQFSKYMLLKPNMMSYEEYINQG